MEMRIPKKKPFMHVNLSVLRQIYAREAFKGNPLF